VKCGWGKEFVLQLGIVIHKIGFNSPTSYFVLDLLMLVLF
jgi:hypothetical protein